MEPLNNSNGAAPEDRSNTKPVLTVLGHVESAMTALAALAIFSMACFICYGVIARNILNISVSDETVIVGDMMIVALVLPLARVAAERGFIVVELLTQRFSKRHARVLAILTGAVGLIATLPITYAGLRAFGDAWQSGNFYFGVLNWPEWPGKLAFLLGYAMFLLRLVILLLSDATSRSLDRETA
ncbi:TRAP transporter small permease subunit [Rhodobacteraceae bacterium LMO-12]|nr:TRAP transporter small permease subunit [Rhodobacteraceae bacterium LMO-JJ12]